jgi:phage baseplate assembly protein W
LAAHHEVVHAIAGWDDRCQLDAVRAHHPVFIDGEVSQSTAVRKLLPRT